MQAKRREDGEATIFVINPILSSKQQALIKHQLCASYLAQESKKAEP